MGDALMERLILFPIILILTTIICALLAFNISWMASAVAGATLGQWAAAVALTAVELSFGGVIIVGGVDV